MSGEDVEGCLLAVSAVSRRTSRVLLLVRLLEVPRSSDSCKRHKTIRESTKWYKEGFM
jgi:hypothetical protein